MELKDRRMETGAIVLTVAGEMDLYNANDFKKAVDRLMAAATTGLVIDLQELGYIDSSGIGALLYTFTRSKSAGTPICFANVHGSVRRVIELTSLLGFLPIADSVESAAERVQA